MNRITVSLVNLTFFAHHGVIPQENTVGNEFTVDLNVYLDPQRLEEDSMRSCNEENLVRTEENQVVTGENLEHTVSYADLYEIVKSEMNKPCQLLETVAIRIAGRIRTTYPDLLGGDIRIMKTTPPIPGITGSAAVKYSWD